MEDALTLALVALCTVVGEAIAKNFCYCVPMEQIPVIGGESDFVEVMSGIIESKGA